MKTNSPEKAMKKKTLYKHIKEIIPVNATIKDYTWRLSDYERDLEWIMIGDVIARMQNHSQKFNKITENPCMMCGLSQALRLVMIEWKNPRQPLRDQSHKCMKLLFKLLKQVHETNTKGN